MRKYFIFLFMLLSPSLLAQDLAQTRAVALSGALRGTVGLNESIYYNPAAFAFSKRYSIEGVSSFVPNQLENATWVYGGSVVDSHSELFAAGFGFHRKIKDISDGNTSESAFHLALSKVVTPQFSLGMTGKYFIKNAPDIESQWVNLDLGSFAVLSPEVQLGLVAHNVLGHREGAYRSVGIGSRFQAYQFLFLSFDALKRLEQAWNKHGELHGGLEIVHNNGVVVQSGLSISDDKTQNFYSLGGGWSEHKVAISYAFQNSMDSLRRATHALSFRIFF